VPFFLFSGFLAVCLCFSWFFLLPSVSKVDIGGKKQSTEEMLQLQTQLISDISTKEEQRRKLLVPLTDPLYSALKSKRETVSYARLEQEIQAQAKKAGETSVLISRITYDPLLKKITLMGDVKAGTKSMTVLANFADLLKRSSLSASLSDPQFIRVEGPDGSHSPFNFSFTLP
jgi:2-succinyl-5-enolpyruvyl-6-hydroxy-3-cyclohexene-1-carboxylate synthase